MVNIKRDSVSYRTGLTNKQIKHVLRASWESGSPHISYCRIYYGYWVLRIYVTKTIKWIDSFKYKVDTLKMI